MAKKDAEYLLPFLKPFDAAMIELVLWLRDFAWDLCPDANELIYDNYNAVAIGWSPTEKVGHTSCSIAVGRSSKNIHFGFYWGSKIADPQNLLKGEGKQYRYLLVRDKKTFPKAYMQELVRAAYRYSLSLVKNNEETVHSKTIVKSVSEKKRPEKKAAKPKSK